MTTEKQMEKGISDIVGVFTDPIIVFPGGWGDTLPEWLKTAITMERLVMNMKALKGEEMTGTDAEPCAYLYTASLTQPMGGDWTQIYLHIAGKTHEKWRTKESGVEMLADIPEESLSDERLRHLNRLKDWIYRQNIKARIERDRMERRRKKEEKEIQKKTEQPVLFEF